MAVFLFELHYLVEPCGRCESERVNGANKTACVVWHRARKRPNERGDPASPSRCADRLSPSETHMRCAWHSSLFRFTDQTEFHTGTQKAEREGTKSQGRERERAKGVGEDVSRIRVFFFFYANMVWKSIGSSRGRTPKVSSIWRITGTSSGASRLIAAPLRPKRPQRPMRWMYFSSTTGRS
jgi:hypothetical protein